MANHSRRRAIRNIYSGDRRDRTKRNPARRSDRRDRTKRNPPPAPSSHRDLISALPNTVIHHIFSFLPIEDVVKTSLLSTRWRSTWRTTPNLVFDGFRLHNGDACSVIDSVLSQCIRTSALKKFHINDLLYGEANDPKLEGWLRFAEQRHVEDLRLGLSNSSQSMYILPRFLFCLSSLVRLQVSVCCFSLGTTSINWPRLKVLSMSNVNLSDDILARIFRGSPLLESLELGPCVGSDSIIINSTSVRHLLLSTNFVGEIRAPNLLSLRVSGTCSQSEEQERISLEDISSLVEAELDFEILTGGPADIKMSRDLLKKLLEQLCRVPTITIGDCCLQILSLLEMEGGLPPLLKCQNLILRGPNSQWDLLGIGYNVRSSQCLEKLVIHPTNRPLLEFQLGEESKELFNFDEEDFLCSRKGNFECLAKHLKRVEIISIADNLASKHLLALIKFLLGYALVLEKLIIKAKLPVQEGQNRLPPTVLSKLLDVSTDVNCFRRASENAVVFFDFPL